MPERRSTDVAVLGGGAAGLFCAAIAARRGRRVLVLERNERPGKKVLVSGGGRANFTNRRVGAENYVSANPHFARSALARFGPEDFLALVEAHRIPWHERRHGQLFCDESAKRITGLLLDECARGGAEILLDCEVRAVEPVAGSAAAAVPPGARFRVSTSRGEVFAASVAVATGGLSWPRLGVTDLGYRVARRFGLPLVPVRPGLVPLLWNRPDRARFGPLAGIAVPGRVATGRVAFEEAVLFTHSGLSGPAILQVSNHWRLGEPVTIDFAPGRDVEAELRALKAAGERGQVRSALLSMGPEGLPRRLVDALLPASVPDRPLAQLPERDLAAAAASLSAFRFVPAADAGWDKAEVTLGGVDTRALDSRTCAARDVPGLYFVGEVVDVTGWLGGFNFQWAWASAHAAGEAC